MKRYNFYFTIFLTACSLIVQASGLQEFNKTVQKEYSVDSDATVRIDNKYGDVDIVSSNRSSVHIKVDIIVEAKDQERANEIIDRIRIDLDGSRREVTAVTEYDFNNSWNWGKRSESYKVHYTVMVPITNDLDIENKYGNISISDMNSDVDVTLKYGNANIQNVGGDFEAELGYVKSFTLASVGGDTELSISYSDVEIGELGELDIVSKYSTIEIEKATEISIESKYDKYDILKANNIECVGKYDNYDIGSLHSIHIETKYTQVKIDELAHSGDFYTGYGGGKIRDLAKDFNHITIEGKYTGYDLVTAGGFQVDIDTQYTGTDLPDGMKYYYREKDGNEQKLKGHYLSDNAGLIKAYLRYGHINIRK